MDRRGFLGCLAAIAGTTVVPLPVVDTVPVKLSAAPSHTSRLIKLAKLVMERNAVEYTNETYPNILKQINDIYIRNVRNQDMSGQNIRISNQVMK